MTSAIQPYPGIQPDSCSGTRSALFPRPATLDVLLPLPTPSRNNRVLGTPDRGPAVFGFQKIRSASNASRLFRTFRESTPSVLGAGRLRPLGDPNTLRATQYRRTLP